MKNIQLDNNMRIARLESVCAAIKAEREDTIEAAYRKAVEEKNADVAAFLARKIRNRLLSESDKEFSLDRIWDRISPYLPDENSSSYWLDWCKALARAKTGAWGEYRQKLRDLPEQDGFPFDIVFPEKPGTKVGDEG